MGLFVRDDGYYQGWLAALLCCWIGRLDPEQTISKETVSKPVASRNTTCNEQPTSLRPLYLNATATQKRYNHGMGSTSDDGNQLRSISDRPPSLKPLEFEDTSLFDKMFLQPRRKSSSTLLDRISIGKPTDFRRLDYTEKQRRSLVPLQLGPVILRESVADFDKVFPSISAEPMGEYVTVPLNSYHVSPGTPNKQPMQTMLPPAGSATNSPGHSVDSFTTTKMARPPLSTQSSSSSIRSLRYSNGDARTSSGSGSLRNSLEKSRLKRKRSGLKMSQDHTDLDIDREILELNTIIEERRAESTRPQTPADSHVPAVAPRMPVRARSETLTDIGSAFSRPLTSVTTLDSDVETMPQVPAQEATSPVIPTKSRLSQPFMSMPDPSIEYVAQQHIRRPSSRVTGWLSNIFSPSSSTSEETRAREDAQRSSHQRAASETSLCTTTSVMESRTLNSSSPMSRISHSRSVTAESLMLTPISPPSTVDDYIEPEAKSRIEKPLPIRANDLKQVGLAF